MELYAGQKAKIREVIGEQLNAFERVFAEELNERKPLIDQCCNSSLLANFML